MREYWIIDPKKERVTVYDLANDDVKEYSFADKVEPVVFQGFWVEFVEMDIF